MKKNFIIIDGNSLLFRAYYAMQNPMKTKEGIYTQGIFGFVNMLNRILTDYSPDYIAVAFDRKSPTFRHEEYDAYKAGRKKTPPELLMQMPLLKEVLAAMNITTLEIDGYEGDDIIGTLARDAEESGLAPLIITGDKDALQLCTDITKVLITKKGISEFEIYDRVRMQERYELTPEQFVDLKGLMGDSSDNIPGIPGIGEKTGIKLLKQFNTMENLLTKTDEIKNVKLREKVEENIQLAILSKRLATINKYVPIEYSIEKMKYREVDNDKLIDIYVKLEFNKFLKALNLEDSNTSKQNKIDLNNINKIYIEDITEVDKIHFNKDIIIKVFSDNNHIEAPNIIGIAILDNDNFYYVNHNEEVIQNVVNIINNNNIGLIGHNLIDDYFALTFYGLDSRNTVFDTAVAQYVIDPTKSTYDISVLALEYLHLEIIEEGKFLKENSQIDLFGNEYEKYIDYGILYTSIIKSLKNLLTDELNKEELMELCNFVEFPLIQVLADMEYQGISVDKNTLEAIGLDLRTEIEKLEKIIYDLAGKKFNINSPIQLGTVLFEDLKLPSGKKTKRGYSTSADVLDKLREVHPIIDFILSYRTLSKLNSTYIEGLKPLIAPDGKIRAHFQQTVTATGRISCTEPNLQNIPIRQELGRLIRKAFIPSDNSILMGADYSQIELRVLAHLSSDVNLIEAFNNGDDIHKITAARVLGIPYDEVTSLDRSKAKAVNFGVIYGMSGFGLSEELHITRKEAENYINEYFNKHQDVKKFMSEQVDLCKANGYTKTILGRKRYIREINSSNYMVKQLGERLAMNSPIQGSAADLIKLAMIKVYHELKKRNLKSKLILQVHDELIIDTVENEREEVAELLVRNMQEAMDLKVKLVSDLNWGRNWYEIK